jgi:hypothetical protein
MQRKYKIAVIALCSLAGIPLVYKALDQIVRIYFQYRVGTLCRKLTPGTSLVEAKRMVQKAGLEQLDSVTGAGWGFGGPLAPTRGDHECSVVDDGNVVKEAHLVVF